MVSRVPDGRRCRQTHPIANDERDQGTEYPPRDAPAQGASRARPSIPAARPQPPRNARHRVPRLPCSHHGSWLLLASPRGMPVRDESRNTARLLAGQVSAECGTRPSKRASSCRRWVAGSDCMGMRPATCRVCRGDCWTANRVAKIQRCIDRSRLRARAAVGRKLTS